MLTYDPLKRCTALEGLSHTYFSSVPWPTHPANLPKTGVPLAPRALGEQQGMEVPDVEGKKGTKGLGMKRKMSEEQRVDETGERIAAKIGRRLEY